MALSALIVLAMRLYGLFLIANMAVSLVPAIVSPSPYFKEAWVMFLSYAAVGLVLVLIPGRISNAVLRIGKADVEPQLSFGQALRVGVILLGVYFVVDAVVWLLFNYAKARLFYDVMKPFANFRGPGLNPEDFAYLTANALQIVLGLALWLGNHRIAELTLRIGDDH